MAENPFKIIKNTKIFGKLLMIKVINAHICIVELYFVYYKYIMKG